MPRGTRDYGEADRNLNEFVKNSLKAFGEGNRQKGTELLGKAQHYLQDLGNPYHTVFWDNISLEIPVFLKVFQHSEYEATVDFLWIAFKDAAKQGAEDYFATGEPHILNPKVNLMFDIKYIKSNTRQRH